MAVLTMAEHEELRRRIESTSLQLQTTGTRLVSDVRRVAGLLSLGGLVNIERTCRYIELFIDWLKRELAKSVWGWGVPWTLWSHGNTWAGEPIQGRVSQHVGRLTRDGLLTEDYWQGRSADAYNFAHPRQSVALEALATRCRTIDDVLTKMAVAIGALWLAVAALLISLLIEYLTESAAAASGVLAPPAAAAAAGSTAKFLGMLSAVMTGVYAFVMTEAVPEIKNLQQELSNDTAFPGGSWPQPSQTLFDNPEWLVR